MSALPNSRPRRPTLLNSYFVGLLILLYLPIIALFLFSLNANTTLTFPLKGLTLDWYRQLFAAEAVLRAALNSLVVAAGSSLVATLLGTMVSILVVRYDFRAKN